MTATLFVQLMIALLAGALTLWFLTGLRWLALLVGILAVLGIVAEAPRAASETWGTPVAGLLAATEESLRLETMRSSGSRVSHLSVQHRFDAIVCYHLESSPGIGAGTPPDPAVLAAVGETPTAADQVCARAPGTGILRQSRVRLTEAAHDAARIGAPLALTVLRPFGLLEWTWPIDAPLLPMLPRPSWGGGAERTLEARVVAITVDTRGRSPISRRAQDYAVPVAHVRLRYAPPGHPDGVEGIDSVDAASVPGLAVGGTVRVRVADGAPRQPMIVDATRHAWWRNPLSELLTLAMVVAALAVGVIWFLRRRRPA